MAGAEDAGALEAGWDPDWRSSETAETLRFSLPVAKSRLGGVTALDLATSLAVRIAWDLAGGATGRAGCATGAGRSVDACGLVGAGFVDVACNGAVTIPGVETGARDAGAVTVEVVVFVVVARSLTSTSSAVMN